MILRLASYWSKIPFILLLLLPSFNLPGQDFFKGSFFPFALGANLELFTDDFYGPSRYQTYSGIAQLGHITQTNFVQSNLLITAGYGVGKADYAHIQGYNLTNVPVSLQYSFRFKVGQWDQKKHTLWAGLVNQNTLNIRFNEKLSNSQTSLAGLFSYGLSTSYQIMATPLPLFSKEKPTAYGVQIDLNLPIGTYVLRPGYVTQMPNNEFGLSEHLFWGDFFHLNLNTSLLIGLNHRNQLRLTYNWDYTEITPLNLYQQGQHQFLIALYTRL